MTLIERWIVIPLIGILIAHGFLAANYPSWIVEVLDQTVAGIFVVVAYIITHRKTVVENPIVTTEQKTIWQKIMSFVFAPKTETVVSATDTPTQTLP